MHPVHAVYVDSEPRAAYSYNTRWHGTTTAQHITRGDVNSRLKNNQYWKTLYCRYYTAALRGRRYAAAALVKETR